MTVGRLRLSLLVLAACAVVPVARATHAQPQQLRIGVVVGNNVGNEPGRALKYAEREVEKLAHLFKAMGEFERIDVLKGRDRQEVEQALKTARAKLEAARAAGRPTLFLFYYSGHGDNAALELGGSRLPLRDLRNHLEHLPADVKLAFVDACQSGALTGVKSTAKGGRRAPAYEVRLADPGQVEGMAIITSSTGNELSQESDDLKGSFFSHNVMTGLKSAADASGDGQVTLNELYQYVFRRTLNDTAASLIGGQHPTFDFRIKGAGDVILTRKRAKDAQIRFPREAGVTYTVVEGDEVTAELVSSPDEDLYISVPAGEYKVVRRTLASVTEQRHSLAAGKSVVLQPATMVAVAYDTNKRKKGDLDLVARGDAEGLVTTVPPRLSSPNLLDVQVGAEASVLPGVGVVPMAGVAYSRAFSALSLRARAALGAFAAEDGGLRSTHRRLALALDVLFPLWDGERFVFLMGPSAGVPIVWQRLENERLPTSSRGVNFVYGGVASAAARIAPRAWITLSAFGGGEVFRLVEADGTRTAHEATASLSLGGAFAF